MLAWQARGTGTPLPVCAAAGHLALQPRATSPGETVTRSLAKLLLFNGCLILNVLLLVAAILMHDAEDGPVVLLDRLQVLSWVRVFDSRQFFAYVVILVDYGILVSRQDLVIRLGSVNVVAIIRSRAAGQRALRNIKHERGARGWIVLAKRCLHVVAVGFHVRLDLFKVDTELVWYPVTADHLDVLEVRWALVLRGRFLDKS